MLIIRVIFSQLSGIKLILANVYFKHICTANQWVMYLYLSRIVFSLSFYHPFQNMNSETLRRLCKYTLSPKPSLITFAISTSPYRGLRKLAFIRVPMSSGNHGKTGKSRKNVHAWKNHGISKNLINHGKIMEFCEIILRNHQ